MSRVSINHREGEADTSPFFSWRPSGVGSLCKELARGIAEYVNKLAPKTGQVA